MSKIDLASVAANVVSDSAYGMDTLNFPDLEDSANDAIGRAAESECIYYSTCYEIIDRYERDANLYGDLSDVIGETTYKADDWQAAMVAYANAVAYTIISVEVRDCLENISHAHSTLDWVAQRQGYDPKETVEPRVSRDCPHGWAPHESESAEGVHYWAPAQLEGCHAVAIKTDSGLWLSYIWNAGKES